MSKELEALERFNSNAVIVIYDELDGESYRKSVERIDKDYDLLKQALKRNEPMKPKVAWKNEEDEGVVGYRCLNCNGSLGAKLDDNPMFPNFCRHCGQKLDWRDEEKHY